MRFTKMHGAGNDYIYVDGFHDALPSDPSALAVLVSDRQKGIGADGLILICPSTEADARMRMFNADGTEAEMCGNGIRCVAKYLLDHAIVDRHDISIATGNGIKRLTVSEDRRFVRVAMGIPQLAAKSIPTLIPPNEFDSGESRVVEAPMDVDGKTICVTCVSMGNPHCVVFMEPFSIDRNDDTEMDRLVTTLGPRIERDKRFPDRVNVEFVEVLSRSEVRQRTWERGSGETLACGTGACAVCVAGVLTNRTERRIQCHLTGGELELEWCPKTGQMLMTGPAIEVFQGEWPE